MKHTGYNTGDTTNNRFKYLYNSKELQGNGNLDYGWRQYMPDLGRWNGIDQLAELYPEASSYSYVLNNPVRFTDPDGRCPQKPDGTYDCYTDIEEVAIGSPPKNSSVSSFPSLWTGPSFLGLGNGHLSSSLSYAGGSGSFGGGLTAITQESNILLQNYFNVNGYNRWFNGASGSGNVIQGLDGYRIRLTERLTSFNKRWGSNNFTYITKFEQSLVKYNNFLGDILEVTAGTGTIKGNGNTSITTVNGGLPTYSYN